MLLVPLFNAGDHEIIPRSEIEAKVILIEPLGLADCNCQAFYWLGQQREPLKTVGWKLYWCLKARIHIYKFEYIYHD